MKKFIVALLVLVAASCQFEPVAAADLIYKDPATGNGVVLRESACSNPELLRYVQTEFKPQFRSGFTYWEGKRYDNCWLRHGDHVDIIDTGTGGGPDTYALPLVAFESAI